MPGQSLRDYQVADLAFYIANPKAGNLSDPGVGKTPSVCVMQLYRWLEHKVGTAWIMPKSLLWKNYRELLRFTDFTPDDITIVDGTPAQIEKQLTSGAKVFLMGFRRFALSWRYLPSYVRAVDVDEFHMGFKSADSAACEALFHSFDSGHMKWFLPMTGTLVNGRLDSAYPAIKIIEPRYYASHKSFLNQHGIYDFDNKLVGWRNHEKLAHIFGNHFIRRTFAQIHGEQEIVHLPKVVEMHPRQREMYDEFHEAAVLDLERFYLDGTLPGVAYIRARQLMEHPNEFPDLTRPGTYFDVMKGTKPAKEDLLEIDLIDAKENGKPVIVFSSMVPQQRRIANLAEQLGMTCGLINGDTSAKERDRVDREFIAGRLDVLDCSPQCASVGYNWQFWGDKEVDHVIFMTLDYLDTTFLQARQRVIREKRSSPLRVSIYRYHDSIDDNVGSIIYRKSLDAHQVDPTRPVLDFFRPVGAASKIAA